MASSGGSTPGSSALSPTDEMVFAKTAKIKQWVVNRLQELEDQNERLRLQNLRCTTQLQMLKSLSDRSKKWNMENPMMSRSVTGALPMSRDNENRTSDDSGLTSDEHCERNIMSMSTMNPQELTPKQQRKVRLRQNSNEDKDSSPSSDNSPWEERAKPIPTPRRTKNNNNGVIERDSLNSFADDYEFDCEDEIFDEIVESPSAETNSNRNKYADYVNLADFCAIRDDKNIYSDIIKPPIDPPKPPEHRTRQWEAKLLQVAENCLSLGDCTEHECSSGTASPYQVTRVSSCRTDSPRRSGAGSKLSFRSSPRVMSGVSSHITSTPDMERNYFPECDYSCPPDARNSGNDIRTSLIPSNEGIEKCGYWNQMSDSRLKSLKRRYVVLKNNQLSFYRTQRNMSKDEEPLLRLHVADLKSVSRINQQGSAYAFQISTESQKYHYMTDSERSTDDWIGLLTQAMKGAALQEMASRSTPLDADISGVLQRVRCGHSRKMFAALVGHKLMFFKNPEDTIPSNYMFLQGARICEKQKSSSDEYSGSSDEQNGRDNSERMDGEKKKEYSISIEICNEDPVYLVLRSREEKEKWMYFLRSSSGDATLYGTPFEVFVQRMLADGAGPSSLLWDDLLLTSSDDPKETLTTVEQTGRKKTIEIAKAIHLFVSVLMRPGAQQYHIDLAQNILQTAIQQDYMRNEVYAQLIRLTSGTMPYGLQGWKLLALALPLFVPQQYALLWLLKKHIAKWSTKCGDEANLAVYCQCCLERSLKTGGRQEGPSRLEVTSVLTRDPTTTKFPHSISVRLPNGEYQVVEFDGSTEVGQCLSSLCLKLGMRPALLSGYALYIDHPLTQTMQLLKGKQKLCDCLTIWEQRQRDVQRGRVAVEGTAKLDLRQRHYWRRLTHTETNIERNFLAWKMSEELVNGRLPISNQLADHLCAVYGQLAFGDLDGLIADQQFDFITQRFYPRKMLDVACLRTLRANLSTHWSEMSGMSENECVRVILQVLRKWPLLGSHLQEAGMRTSNDRRVFIALHDTGVHILDARHMDVIRSFPFHRLVSFGGFHNDFMITVDRVLPPEAHPEETPKERITFSMEAGEIEQLTLHLAEYIRCQKLVWKVSK